MRHFGNRKIAAASAGLFLCMALTPLPVYAEESGILQAAGVASVLETKLSTEEYIELGQQAQGAAWGYTNIGIANVESGNLNVRETPSTDGKMVGKMPKDSACEVLETADGWAYIKSPHFPLFPHMKKGTSFYTDACHINLFVPFFLP